MPAESAPPPQAGPATPTVFPLSGSNIKCSHCGGTSLPSLSAASRAGGEGEGVIILDEEIERVCASCWRAQVSPDGGPDMRAGEEQYEEGERRLEADISSIGLGLRGMTVNPVEEETSPRDGQAQVPQAAAVGVGDAEYSPPMVYAQPVPIASTPAPAGPQHGGLLSHSLPSQHTRPWVTQPTRVSPITEERGGFSATPAPTSYKEDRPYNPLLDITSARVSNRGRGALYPGSVFKGTQTSGRSAYDVEVRFIDVNFPESSVSGYLSISHLTDTHPHLTTFFTGEIIGPRYGFITGPRYGATEHDDMRHWGRFEQFRRPATRGDMIRPELLFRDPVPRPGTGGAGRVTGMERDFVFLRIKERFLVPDHTVKDISGASFAGFYFAMIDLNPTSASDPPLSPTSPLPKSPPTLPPPPLSPTTSNSQYFPTMSLPTPSAQRRQSTGPPAPAPALGLTSTSTSGSAGGFGGLPSHPTFTMPRPAVRRMSSNGPGPRSPGLDSGPGAGVGTGASERRRRRESSGAVPGRGEREPQREATIRGYYFHSLNQEPFQELFLTHVPNRSSGTYEMR